jgi:BMFP domain-containing protein YqiC
MQTRSPIFDDIAKLANGALGALTGLRTEIELLVRQQFEKILIDMDLVPREEFDAVKEMAAKARQEQEALAVRVAALEALLASNAASATSEVNKRPSRAKQKPAAESAP